jgi:hypothetical protein
MDGQKIIRKGKGVKFFDSCVTVWSQEMGLWFLIGDDGSKSKEGT